ncbi:RecX family transcriptional regulator [Candidatus Dependentiae bacterium]|nr:RecX family transcriptional regulator [Candidatus Dependentiae bacterium]
MDTVKIYCGKVSNGKNIVRFSNGFEKIMPVKVYNKTGVFNGMALSFSEADFLIEKIEKLIAEEIIIRKLKSRKRTEFEIVNELKKNQISLKVIDAIIEKYKYLKLIDDNDYSRSYINDQVKLNKKPLRKIKNELLLKNIDRNIIENAVSDLKNNCDCLDTDLETCKKLILKKTHNNIELLNEDHDLKDKIKRFLFNKGFDYETIKQCFIELSE